MNLEESKVLMNIEKYGNTHICNLPLVLHDFEHQKRGYNYFAAFWRIYLGSIYLNGHTTKNKFKLKTNNYGFKRNSEPNQICSKLELQLN
jgi:hypothetical protein